MHKVALVTNVLSHYRVPCFRSLARRAPGRVTYFVLARDMAHRRYVLADHRDGLDAVPLRGVGWSRSIQDDAHLNDITPVMRGDYEVVILGAWDEPTYLLLWAWAVATRKRLVFWIESTAHDMGRTSKKEALKRFLLRSAAGCIVPGVRAREYCRGLGVADDRIFTAPNATDGAFFRAQADRLLPMRETLRREASIEGTVFLFVGRLVEEFKQVSTLIEAVGRLQKEGHPVTLLLAGDGPDRFFYEQLPNREPLRDIRFLGVLEHDALCPYYAMADVLVLPSRSETWGFVLNEGMEFGLPLVVSEAVGAGPDLVKPGENGFVVPVGDAGALADALEKLAEDEGLRSRMGEASRKIVQSFTPERWAQGVMDAIDFALSRK